jgi:hypothetical protein
MAILIILGLVYLFGYYLAFTMNRIELEVEKLVYTRRDRMINIVLSLLSWLLVIVLLVQAWFKMIGPAYFNQPVKPLQEEPAK